MGRLPTPEQRALGLQHAHEAMRLRYQAVRDAEKTLCDRSAPSSDKRAAREVLQQWRERQSRRNAKRRLGPRPQAQDFPDEAAFSAALNKWRDAVQVLRCEAVLDNPSSSMEAAELAAGKIRKIKAKQNVTPAPVKTRLICAQNGLFKRVPA